MENEEISKNEQVLQEREKKFFNWFKDKYNLVLFLLIFFTILIRVYYFFMTLNQPLWWDEAEYMVIAQRWAFNIPQLIDPVRQVFFPFIISLFLRINEGEFLSRFVVFFLSVASVIGTYLLGKEMFNKKIGMTAGLLMSVFYMNLFFSQRILVDIHSLAFFTFSALFFYKYFKDNSKKYLYIAAVLIGIGTLFKLTTAYLLVAVLIYFFTTDKLNFLKKKEVWISATIYWLILSPYLIWGYLEFHGFVLTKAASVTAPVKLNQGIMTIIFSYISSGFSVIKSYLMYLPTYIFSIDWSKTFSFEWYLLITALMALFLITFYKLFIGFDLLLKHNPTKESGKEKELKRDLYLFLIMLVPLILVSIMISHYEDRYAINIFPAFFIMIGAFVMKVFNIIKNKKYNSIAFLFLIIVLLFFAYSQLKFSDSSIKGKLGSYSQIRDAGLWFKENSQASDIMVTVSVSQVKYYSKRQIIPIPDTQEEFELKIIPEKHPKYFMLSGFEQGPEWSRSYPQEENLSIANVFFIDDAKTQPIVIIYNLPSNPSNFKIQEMINQTGIN